MISATLPYIPAKRLVQRLGVLRPGLVVEVALRGRVVGVTHVGLNRVGVERRDRARAEVVAQVVESDAP